MNKIMVKIMFALRIYSTIVLFTNFVGLKSYNYTSCAIDQPSKNAEVLHQHHLQP